jgi:glycosyltransferase involved in cell wall biosynthesis
MRVALLSHNARTGDAVGNQVAAKAAFFRDRGADVRAYVESDRDLQPALRPFLRLILSEEPLPALAAELAELDLLCVEYSQYYPSLEALPFLSGKRPKIIADYHGVTPPELWAGPPEVLRESQRRRGLLWFADEVAVHSRFMQRELESATHYPAERIHQLPLPLEINQPQRETGPLRQRLGLTDTRILLFVGRLATNKRVPILIEAVARLKDDRPPVHAVIVGDTGDLYQTEFERCRDLAERLGVADRVHFLGRVSRDDLTAAYRTANVFVMPSTHEGFCIPVIEAMAHGVPVVAARAGALPETLGDAGLSFTPDDVDDLVRQVRRVLQPKSMPAAQPEKRRIAIVAAGYGDSVLGGAERSLRLIAESLADAGHNVEVFATGAAGGVETVCGVHVHRFLAVPVDGDALAACTQRLGIGSNDSEQTVREFFALTQTSPRLLDSLEAKREEFDAIIAGPYASGLTWAVAERFPGQPLLLACLHDEPLARQPLVRDHYSRVAGVLYHSPEEQEFAQVSIGLHHPNSGVIGTWLAESCGDPDRGRTLAGQSRPYIVYCGRYCREKGVATLVEWLTRYADEFPNRFGIVFTGAGAAALPPCVTDLGFLTATDKTDVVSGAAALVLISTNESLSLAALEAWREGVPVISHADSAVLAGHQRRSGGGRRVSGYEEFRAALNDLWQNPHDWRTKGKRGREYVQREYNDRAAFVSRIDSAVAAGSEPISETMTRKGLRRAEAFTPETWTAAFAEQVERVLHRESVEPVLSAAIETTSPLTIAPNLRRVAIRLTNTGTLPLLRDGPSASRVCSQVLGSDGEPVGAAVTAPLPETLVPGQTVRLAVRIAGQRVPGHYVVRFRVSSTDACVAENTVPLTVGEVGAPTGGALDVVHAALADAESIAELPAGYTDVTEGRFAAWKRAIKHKLLHQLRSSYVEVLSRQQTAFNRSVLAAVQELAECTATLERAIAEETSAAESELSAAVARLGKRAHQAVDRIAELEKRLERLEALVSEFVECSPREGR